MAEDREDRLRGGKAFARDPWFGLRSRPHFKAFRRHWHSEKKYTGRDLVGLDEAHEIYEEWVREHHPDRET